MVGGSWQWLAVGRWSPLEVGGGWPLAVGGRWRLVAVGGWRSLGSVLEKKGNSLRIPLVMSGDILAFWGFGPTGPPTHSIKTVFLRRKVKSIQEARHWRSIFGTHTFFGLLNPHPPTHRHTHTYTHIHTHTHSPMRQQGISHSAT